MRYIALLIALALLTTSCSEKEPSSHALQPDAGTNAGTMAPPLTGGMGATGGSGGSGGAPMLDASAGGMSGGSDSGPMLDAATDAETDADVAPDAAYFEAPGTDGDGQLEIDAPYMRDPDLTDLGNPEGQEFNFQMPLADSEIFKGDDATLDSNKPVRTERNIWVYVPDAYVDGTEAPILVIHDGRGQLGLVRYALDNLTISTDPDRALPAFIAIAVENGGDDSKGSERGLEYDTMSDRLARFIELEVLPAVLSNAQIKAAYPNLAFTSNPWGKAAMGCSSGGAAALTMVWFRPDLFRRAVTYSGTFVDQQDDDAPEEALYPLGAWDYHSGLELIASSEPKPLRIFLHSSENDLGAGSGEAGHHDWVLANERTADALQAKGYHYRYVHSLATGHCDGAVFDQTLADTLVWLWRGYHADP